jgi:hypothetical protein
MFVAALLRSKANLHQTIKNIDREEIAFGRIKRPKLSPPRKRKEPAFT